MPRPKNWPNPSSDVSPVMAYVAPGETPPGNIACETGRRLDIAMHEQALTIQLYRPDGRLYRLEIWEQDPGDSGNPAKDDIRRLCVSVISGDEDGLLISPCSAGVHGHTKKQDSDSWLSSSATLYSANRDDGVVGPYLSLSFHKPASAEEKEHERVGLEQLRLKQKTRHA